MDLLLLDALIGCLASKNPVEISTSSTFGGDTRLSNMDEEISNTDDFFDYLKVGMAAGEFEGVSSDVSSISDTTDGSDSEDISDIMGNHSLLGPSSIADISDDGRDRDEGSNSDSTSDLSSETDASSGRPAKRTRRASKRARRLGLTEIPILTKAFINIRRFKCRNSSAS